jgi:hypothetical protein
MRDRADGLRVSESRHEPPVDDGQDGALGARGGIRRLIEYAAHLAVAFESIGIPPSQRLNPATLCPPERTAINSSRS